MYNVAKIKGAAITHPNNCKRNQTRNLRPGFCFTRTWNGRGIDKQYRKARHPVTEVSKRGIGNCRYTDCLCETTWVISYAKKLAININRWQIDFKILLCFRPELKISISHPFLCKEKYNSYSI